MPDRRRTPPIDRGEQRRGPVAIVRTRHHLDDEALRLGAAEPFQHRRRMVVLQQQHAAAARHGQHLAGGGDAVAHRGDQRDVVRIGVDQARGGGAGALELALRVARLDRPGLRLARDADLAGCLHRARQRADSGGVQVADVLGDIEQRALRRQHGGSPAYSGFYGRAGVSCMAPARPAHGHPAAAASSMAKPSRNGRRLDDPRRSAARRGARDADTPGAMRTEPLLGQQFAVERHAGRAGEGTAGAGRDQAARRIHRHAGGDAAAGGAAVDLALAEHAEIARRVRRSGRRVVGQDGAVKEREVGLGRVAHLAARADRLHDRQRRRAQLSDRRGVQVEAHARCRQDGVERTAIADVAEDAAERREDRSACRARRRTRARCRTRRGRRRR